MSTLHEINRRRIGLTFALDTWIASVEVIKNKKKFTAPQMKIVSAQGKTVEEAVATLVHKLDAQVELFEEEAA